MFRARLTVDAADAAVPARGDVWVVEHAGTRGLALLVARHDTCWTTRHVHSSIEMATDVDLIVAGRAAYPIVAAGEMYGTVFETQLVRRVTRLSEAETMAAARALQTDGESLDGFRTGIPLAGCDDPRRRFLAGEIDVLTALAAPSRRLGR